MLSFWSCCFLTSCMQDKERTILATTVSISDNDTQDHHFKKGLISVKKVDILLDQQCPIVIFELSKKKKFDEGHLPNAIHLWRPDYENTSLYPFEGMMATQEEIEQLLSSKGVSSNTEIILYDTKGGSDAFRFRWVLNQYGYDQVKVINGGKTAWTQAGHALSKSTTKIANPTAFTFPKAIKKDQLADIEMVKAAILDTNVILLDTREPEEFLGQPYLSKGKLYPHKKGAYINGCIPTAIHLNWSDAVDLKTDHRLKSIKDLKYNFEKAGVIPDKEIIVYCQSGVRSAHTTYVLSEILSYPNVKNYDGSWIEWSYHHVKLGDVEIQQLTSTEDVEAMMFDLGKGMLQ